jgi:type I restriction enzyme, S subunit
MTLPEYWINARLTKVAKLVGGGTPSRTRARYFGGEIPWATPSDLSKLQGLYLKDTAEKITESGARDSSVFRLPVGAVLMTSRATIGLTAIITKETTTNQGFANFICDETLLDNKYLALNLRFIRPKIIQRSSGSTFLEISRSELGKLEIALPPMLEQGRIVSILKQAEKVRQKRLEAQDKAREVLGTLFKEIFGEVHPTKNKTSIGKLANVLTGSTPRKTNSTYFGGSFPWVTSAELEQDFIYDAKEKLTQAGLNETTGDLLPEGTILLAMYGQGKTRGKSAILKIKATTNQACAAIIPHDPKMTYFIWTWLQISYDFIRDKGQGAGQLNLNLDIVRNLILPTASENDIDRFNLIFEQFFLWKNSTSIFLDDFRKTQASITASAFAGALTQNWREQPDIARILEQQVKERNVLLDGKNADVVENPNIQIIAIKDLATAKQRKTIAEHILEHVNNDNTIFNIQSNSETTNATQWRDTALQVLSLAQAKQSEEELTKAVKKLQETLQNTEDVEVQTIVTDLPSLESRAELDPDSKNHPRATFWNEILEGSALRTVYNAIRIASDYSNLQIITETLQALNEPLPEYRITQALNTLESAGIIQTVILEIEKPDKSGFVFIPAYRLPNPEPTLEKP